MGTNYYLHERPPCPTCGREYERLHIGKSSGGWCFSLHVIPEEVINDLPDWVERWSKPGAVVKNEYGDVVHPENMHAAITEREWHQKKQPTPDFCAENHCEPGPAGLVRHRIDGRHCIAHGAGTWDLIVGEFS